MLPKKQSGQGLVEYAVIAGIAVIVIAVVYYGLIYPRLPKSQELIDQTSQATVQTLEQAKNNGYQGGDLYSPQGGYISCNPDQMTVSAHGQEVCVPRTGDLETDLTKAQEKASQEDKHAVSGWLLRVLNFLFGK